MFDHEKKEAFARKNKIFFVLAVILTLCMLVEHASAAGTIEAEVVKNGEYSQVSTITGTGVAGQGTYTVDHPSYPVVNSKGKVYFLDGDQKHKKLRMWDGKKNTTIVDMNMNKVTRREGEFYSSGLAIVKDVVYFTSKDKAYKLVGDRVTEMTNVTKWMKANEYHYIYRVEAYKGNLTFMFWSKAGTGTYGFAEYNPQNGSMTELLDKGWYGYPTNFQRLQEGIAIATEDGFIYYEQYFPRKSKTFLNTNEGMILDVWVDSEKTLYYSLVKDKLKPVICFIPNKTLSHDESEVFIGSTMGYTDGIADEVQMVSPTDFSWDGTGYIFADRDNNAIRKVWIDNKPLS